MISGLPVESAAHVSLRVHQFCVIETTRVQKIQLSLLDHGNPVTNNNTNIEEVKRQ